MAAHPLAAWIETTFGLCEEPTSDPTNPPMDAPDPARNTTLGTQNSELRTTLVRQRPTTFTDGLARLVAATGLPPDLCAQRLKAVLEAGAEARTASGAPVFAFRLHQFMASGRSVFATLEALEQRLLTMEEQDRAPDGEGERLLYPLAFCRECGQEYYLVSRCRVAGGEMLMPRAPLRALASTGTGKSATAHVIECARFLGLSEFGPWNVIYHEGAKHRIVSCVVPAAGLEPRLTSAKICRRCGYIHPGAEGAGVDLCVHCGTKLDGATMDYPQKLLDQPSVRATRWVRITSDEEERSREGYRLTTHYRFAPGARTVRAAALDGDGASLLDIVSAPQATLYRINHGWRRSPDQQGFTLDLDTGQWRKRGDDPIDETGIPRLAARKPLGGFKPYVTDNRNILLLLALAVSP